MLTNPDSAETHELLTLIREGRPAFDRLFSRHRQALRRAVAMRFDPALSARADPSDVVQETQLEAFRRLPDFLERKPMPFHLWLRKMAHERLIMLRRRHVLAVRRSVHQELPLPNRSSVMLGQQVLADGKSPSQALSSDELIRHVRRSVSRLSDTDREIVLMRTYEGMSYDEIAAVLDVEVPATRKRYGRALIKLHRLLKETGLSESDL